MDIQLRERVIGDQPAIGAGNTFPKAVQTVEHKQFLDRAFHRRGQLLTEERG